MGLQHGPEHPGPHKCGPLHVSTSSRVICACGEAATPLSPDGLFASSPAAADNHVREEGALALGAALEPKQNPDGTWVFNTALSTLDLRGAGPVPPTGVERLYHRECLTIYGPCLLLQTTTILEKRELWPWEPPLSQSRTLIGHGSSTRP